jgi:hypothetical protein
VRTARPDGPLRAEEDVTGTARVESGRWCEGMDDLFDAWRESWWCDRAWRRKQQHAVVLGGVEARTRGGGTSMIGEVAARRSLLEGAPGEQKLVVATLRACASSQWMLARDLEEWGGPDLGLHGPDLGRSVAGATLLSLEWRQL